MNLAEKIASSSDGQRRRYYTLYDELINNCEYISVWWLNDCSLRAAKLVGII